MITNALIYCFIPDSFCNVIILPLIILEKGYEEWDKYSSGDDQPIEERGLEDDEDIQDFNVMPKLLNEQGEAYS